MDISIEVVDPNAEALSVAKQRYDQIPENIKILDISYFSNLMEASAIFDIVIVATNANHRYGIVQELLTTKRVKYLILEKVLFQKLDEYDQIDKILDKYDVPCWVNHTRRLFPFYQLLKEKLKGEKQLSVNVQGGDWGLACNGLHFIDLIAYLADSQELILDPVFLNNNIYSSKRPGYIEIQGLLSGKIGDNIFTLYSNEEPGLHIISIASDHYRYIIDEANGMVWESSVYEKWQWKSKQEKIVYFQSELTQTIVEKILTEGICSLPTYHEATAMHKPFIKTLLNHYNQIKNLTVDILPIT